MTVKGYRRYSLEILGSHSRELATDTFSFLVFSFKIWFAHKEKKKLVTGNNCPIRFIRRFTLSSQPKSPHPRSGGCFPIVFMGFCDS